MSNLSSGTHVAEPSANKDCRKLLNQFCRFLPKLKLPISADAKLPLTGSNPRIKKILVREHNRFELTQIRLDAGKFFKPIMDESRRFGKICWSDLVMLTEASVCGNIRIKYVD